MIGSRLKRQRYMQELFMKDWRAMPVNPEEDVQSGTGLGRMSMNAATRSSGPH